MEKDFDLGGDKCSVCGGKVEYRMLLSNPPINEWRCNNCGAKKQVRQTPPPSQIIQMD